MLTILREQKISLKTNHCKYFTHLFFQPLNTDLIQITKGNFGNTKSFHSFAPE